MSDVRHRRIDPSGLRAGFECFQPGHFERLRSDPPGKGCKAATSASETAVPGTDVRVHKVLGAQSVVRLSGLWHCLGTPFGARK